MVGIPLPIPHTIFYGSSIISVVAYRKQLLKSPSWTVEDSK
jgi:hypothetical protein